MKGEFCSMSISKNEIHSYKDHCAFMNKWERNIKGMLEQTIELIQEDTSNLKECEMAVKKRWGLHAIEISWKKNIYDFGQWMACGIYFHEKDFGIKFKEAGMPELAFFMDMNNKKVLKLPEALKRKFKELQYKGFEDNSNGEVTKNRWRVLFKRKPLSQIDGDLNEKTVAEFFKQCIEVFKKDGELNKLL